MKNTPTTKTLDNVTFMNGYAGPYDLDLGGSPYSDASDESKLIVKDMYGTVIPVSYTHLTLPTNREV